MTNGGEPVRRTRGEARRGFRVWKRAGVRAASVLLIALAASCTSNTGAGSKRDHPECDARGAAPSPSTEPASVSPRTSPYSAEEIAEFRLGRPRLSVKVVTDARGVRHYAFSDGSALALDPLEPLNPTQAPR